MITDLNELSKKLDDARELIITTEGVKKEKQATHLRIAYYGCDDFGETVFIGTREEVIVKANQLINEVR